MKFTVLTATILLGSTIAGADDHVDASAQAAAPSIDVIATQPLALVARGLSVSYEHLMLPHTSAVILGGVRVGATGDYDSATWTGGGELRFWPLSTDMRRLYVGLHASAGHTSLTDNVMQTTVGSSWGLSERLDVGYRFVAKRHLTLTPSLGFAMREDVDSTGRLATTTRAAVTIGFEVGWMQRH